MPCFAAVGRMTLLSALAVVATRTTVASEPMNLLSNGGAEEPADRPNAPPGWFAAAIAAPELQMFIDDRHSRAGNASLAITNQHQYDHRVGSPAICAPTTPKRSISACNAGPTTDNA